VLDLDGNTVAELDAEDVVDSGAVFFNRDASRVAALSPTHLTIWDLADKKEIQRVRLQRQPSYGAFNNAGDKFVISFGDDVDVLDVASGKAVSLDITEGSSVSVFFSQDPRMIITAASIPTPETASQPLSQRAFVKAELSIWDADGKLVRKIETDDPIYSAVISDDGKRIATTTRENAMTVWGLE
jgi:hypothetical protein